MYNLCILTSHFYPVKSSCSTLFRDLIKSLLKKNFKITIMTISGFKEEIKVIKTKKINYIGIQNKHLKSSQNYLRALGDIIAILKLKKFYSNQKEKSEFDQVIVYSPSIFWGLLLTKLKKKKVSLKLGDLYPKWLVDHKIINKYSLNYLFLKFFELFLYWQANTIFVQTEKDIDYLKKYKKKLNFEIQTIYNWINLDRVRFSKFKRNNNKYIRFIFIGVIGIAQDYHLIFKIIKYCRDNNFNVTFFFIGSGNKKNELMDQTKNFKNVFFAPEVNISKLDQIIQKCDVCLSTLSQNFYSDNFPGRILRYMLNNKPIIVHSPNNTFLKKLILSNNLGLYSTSEQELFLNIQTVFSDFKNFKKLGCSGFEILKNQYSCEIAEKKFFN